MWETMLHTYSLNPTPDKEAKILSFLEGEITSIASTLLPHPPTDDDLQAARLGALDCLRHYIPEKGPFPYLLPFYVRKSISRNRKPLVHIPYHVRLLWYKRKRFKESYFLTHCQEPDDTAICQALGVNLRQLKALERAALTRDLLPLTDLFSLSCEPPNYHKAIDVTNALSALSEENPLAAHVARLKFCEDLTQKEIGESLSLSSKEVVRLLKIAKEFLQSALAEYA